MQAASVACFLQVVYYFRKVPIIMILYLAELLWHIPAGTIIELVGKVIAVGNTSLRVSVDIFVEQMYEDQREKAISGTFSLVAIDENKKPVSIK